MSKHVLALFVLCLRIVISCDVNVHVCLTWQSERDQITFKCRVSQLRWRLYFYNPANKEEGHCLSPIPFPSCFSLNNVISQDVRTNTTSLLIQGHVDKNVIGTWRCIHGTKREEAFVNVTVINTDHCVEGYLVWTFIGGVICITTLLIIKRAVNTNKNLKSFLKKRKCGRDDICGKNLCVLDSNVCFGILKLSIWITWLSLVIIIPLYFGLLQNDCKDKFVFLIYGLGIVPVLVICISLPRKRVRVDDQNEQSERPMINMDVNSPGQSFEQPEHVMLNNNANNQGIDIIKD